MKFIVSSNSLLKSLQAISGVLNTSNTLPILDDFLFRTFEEQLIITASDLETTMSVSLIPEKLEEGGNIAIPAKILLDTLKTLPDVPLFFSIHPETFAVEIVAAEGKFKLTGHNGAEFPTPPVLNDAVTFNLKSDILYNAINKTIFATGNDELRPAMSGVFFQLAPGNATFVATDAHKLVRYRRNDVTIDVGVSFIMPKKPLNQLKNNLPDEEEVRIDYNITNARFSFGNITLVCRLIEGKYPNYEAVIPRDNPSNLMVHRSTLLNSIKRVAIFANQSTHQIRFRIAGQELNLSAEDIDFSNEGNERLQCQFDGADLEIGFNSKFLIEMLQNLHTDQIRMELSAPNRAGLIIPVDNENESEVILMLVMPVMLN
ncbi:MAG: DNA polymerase III subunit beta [Bacteroidales bacterium]|nr:DNA polymerase III subunit beta [Bacteroidales bacterium]